MFDRRTSPGVHPFVFFFEKTSSSFVLAAIFDLLWPLSLSLSSLLRDFDMEIHMQLFLFFFLSRLSNGRASSAHAFSEKSQHNRESNEVSFTGYLRFVTR